MGDLKTDLKARGYELIETHISWVFLGPDDVYKVKRPVDMGFLNFTKLEARKAACEAEVHLNSRLAAGVYLGVVPVTRGEDGFHRIEGDGAIVDWAVHMRRLSDATRADRLLEKGVLDGNAIDRLADRIVVFHEDARCDEETSEHGRVEVIRRNVIENFEQTADSMTDYLTEEEAAQIRSWQLTALEDHDLFESRIVDDRVRDGHGDLRLEHVYFDADGALSIIDCIEFNDRFRYADVCADIAFLSMDLAWHGRVDLAERLLARYAREAEDYDLYRVVDFYESYRAFVRGKVASFLASDENASISARTRARAEARRYFLLSLAFERPPLVGPRVVAVGGLIASGKSTVATYVAELLSAPILGSDRTRKRLVGKRPTESIKSAPWSGAYSEEASRGVYQELLRRAAIVVDSGRPVVIDASFRTRAARDEVRSLAASRGVPFSFVECVCPRALVRSRLEARDRGGEHESDARADLLEEFERGYEPVEELPSSMHHRVPTERPSGQTRQLLSSLVAPWSPAQTPGSESD